MNDETTLGLAAGSDGLPARIAEYARKVAKTAAETNRDGFLTKQIESLGTAAEFITSRGRFDPRIYGLWAIAGCFGDANHFEPRRGGKQAHLFQQIGTIRGRPVPLPETTLNELLAARVFDLIEHFAAIQAESHTKVDQALRKQEAAEAAQTGALADAEELQRVSDELGAWVGNGYLCRTIEGTSEVKTAPIAMKAPRVVRKASLVLAGQAPHRSGCPEERKSAGPVELQQVVDRALKAPLGAGRALATQ